MKRFNHAVTIGFSIITNDPEGNDFTPAALREALMQRIADLDADPAQWLEAVGAPFDTYEDD